MPPIHTGDRGQDAHRRQPPSQVELFEREVPTVVWGTTSTTSGAAAASFEKNQIAARGEGRFALVVPQPGAIAVVTLP